MVGAGIVNTELLEKDVGKLISTKTPFSPEEVGYDGNRLKVLNQHFEKMLEKKEIQGAAYSLAIDGKVFTNTALGKFSYKETDDRPLKPDTIYRVFSITKLFCAVAIIQLAEDGKLRLDQTVGEFLEEFKAPPFNKINIAQLLTHTSGLAADPGCFENKYYKAPWDFIEHIKDTKDANWIEAGLSAVMRTEPGKEWAYCSFGYVILGEIIERVTGVFSHDYIMENIVKPCEMDDTSFEPDLNKAERYILHFPRFEKYLNSLLAGEKKDNGIWSKVPATWNGMYSTTADLIKFGTMLLNKGTFNGKRIIGRKAVEKMTSVYTTPDVMDYCWNSGGVYHRFGLGPDMKYNLGTLYSPETFFHEGYGTCCLTIDPAEKLVAVWFAPFVGDNWYAHAINNVSAIIWSGLK